MLGGSTLGPINQKSNLPDVWSGSFSTPCFGWELCWVGGGCSLCGGGLAVTRLALLGTAAAVVGCCIARYHHADSAAHLQCIPGNLWHQYDFLWPLSEYGFERSACDSIIRMLIKCHFHNRRVKLVSAITEDLLNVCTPGHFSVIFP